MIILFPLQGEFTVLKGSVINCNTGNWGQIQSSILEFKICLLLFRLLENLFYKSRKDERSEKKYFLEQKLENSKKSINKKCETRSDISLTGNINGLSSLLKTKTSSVYVRP